MCPQALCGVPAPRIARVLTGSLCTVIECLCVRVRNDVWGWASGAVQCRVVPCRAVPCGAVRGGDVGGAEWAIKRSGCRQARATLGVQYGRQRDDGTRCEGRDRREARARVKPRPQGGGGGGSTPGFESGAAAVCHARWDTAPPPAPNPSPPRPICRWIYTSENSADCIKKWAFDGRLIQMLPRMSVGRPCAPHPETGGLFGLSFAGGPTPGVGMGGAFRVPA